MINQTEEKQKLLERFVVKGINVPYYFKNISKDIGLEIEIVQALCQQMADMKYLSISQLEASLTNEGYVYYHSGGFDRILPDLRSQPNKKQEIASAYSVCKKWIITHRSDIVKNLIIGLILLFVGWYFSCNGDRNN